MSRCCQRRRRRTHSRASSRTLRALARSRRRSPRTTRRTSRTNRPQCRRRPYLRHQLHRCRRFRPRCPRSHRVRPRRRLRNRHRSLCLRCHPLRRRLPFRPSPRRRDKRSRAARRRRGTPRRRWRNSELRFHRRSSRDCRNGNCWWSVCGNIVESFLGNSAAHPEQNCCIGNARPSRRNSKRCNCRFPSSGNSNRRNSTSCPKRGTRSSRAAIRRSDRGGRYRTTSLLHNGRRVSSRSPPNRPKNLPHSTIRLVPQ